MKQSRKPAAGFTLIELMAVITIIVILAGLVVAGMGYVNDRQAREKAKIQIGLLEKALEEYKMDNGQYPMFQDPAGTGTGRTTELFRLLYLEGMQKKTKIYLPELNPKNNKMGWTSGSTETSSSTIVDPWGNEYRYRSAMFLQGSTLRPNARTQNPDYDLWSAGKDADSDTTNSSPKQDKNRDDIRNF